MRIPVFWDTSALAPLCVPRGVTPRAIGLYKLHDAVVRWATPVEVASTLTLLVRMKQLDSSDWTRARKLAKRLADLWSMIQPSDAFRAKSAQLFDCHDLRAADSFQLAAVMGSCEVAPHGRVSVTDGQRLMETACSRGFEAKQL